MTTPVQPPIIDNIPSEIRASQHCVGWELRHREGELKPTKVPINITTGELASTTNPATCARLMP